VLAPHPALGRVIVRRHRVSLDPLAGLSRGLIVQRQNQRAIRRMAARSMADAEAIWGES
jgi:hypothetical protein